MSFLLAFEESPIPHLFRHSVVLLVLSLSLFSGVLLPLSLHEKKAVLGERTRYEKRIVAKKTEHAVARLEQLHEVEIKYRKAPKPSPKRETIKPGVATQIGEHTWTVQVASDSKQGTASEVLQALNSYRQQQGRGVLSWDSKLAAFAQSRANAFSASGGTDAHAGFQNLINNQDGFHKLGFMAVGENSSFGYQLEAVNLIEKVYAADAPHNDNQLNSQWTHVGVGVSGVATDLVFGGRKM